MEVSPYHNWEDKCWVSAGDLDVTNDQEFYLFIGLFVLLTYLCLKIAENFYLYQRRKNQPNVHYFKTINYLILFTCIAELLQKGEQIGFYVYYLIQKNKDVDTVIVQTIIYYILTSIKYSLHYVMIVENAYLWFEAIDLHRRRQQRRLLTINPYVKIFWKYGLAFVIILLNLFNCISYLFCKYPLARKINLLTQSILTMAIFIFTIYYVTRYKLSQSQDERISSFLVKLKFCNWILYVAVFARIVYLSLCLTQIMKNLKTYNRETLEDSNWNWFIFLFFYQPTVGILPLFYLALLVRPETNDGRQVGLIEENLNHYLPQIQHEQ